MASRRARRWRRPTPAELSAAPDLAILAVLDVSIQLAVAALRAAQPELRSPAGRRGYFADDAALHAARVITAGRRLAAALRDYRAARRAATTPHDW